MMHLFSLRAVRAVHRTFCGQTAGRNNPLGPLACFSPHAQTPQTAVAVIESLPRDQPYEAPNPCQMVIDSPERSIRQWTPLTQ